MIGQDPETYARVLALVVIMRARDAARETTRGAATKQSPPRRKRSPPKDGH
jgi:hypothetical protein